MAIYINELYKSTILKDLNRIVGCNVNVENHLSNPESLTIPTPLNIDDEVYSVLKIKTSLIQKLEGELSEEASYFSELINIDIPILIHAVQFVSFSLHPLTSDSLIDELIEHTKDGIPYFNRANNFFSTDNNGTYGGLTAAGFMILGGVVKKVAAHIFYDSDYVYRVIKRGPDSFPYYYSAKNNSDQDIPCPSWIILYHELIHVMEMFLPSVNLPDHSGIIRYENIFRLERGLEERSSANQGITASLHLPFSTLGDEDYPEHWHLKTINCIGVLVDLSSDSSSNIIESGVAIVVPSRGWTRHPAIVKNETLRLGLGRKYPTISSEIGESAILEDLVNFPNSSLVDGTSLASLIIGHQFIDTLENINLSVGDDSVKAICGIAPKANIIPHIVVNNSDNIDSITLTNLANCILDTALAPEGCNKASVLVITMGWRLNKKEVLRKALVEARKNGVIVIATCGESTISRAIKKEDEGKSIEDRADFALYPGNSKDVISVIGCDKNEHVPKRGYGLYVAKDENQNPTKRLVADVIIPGWGLTVAGTSRDWSTGKNIYYYDRDVGSNAYAAALMAGACSLWIAYHGRSTLIELYDAPYLFDAFKLALSNSVRDPIPLGTPQKGFEEWNPALHGGNGILDVEKLLKQKLPKPADVKTQADASRWMVQNCKRLR